MTQIVAAPEAWSRFAWHSSRITVIIVSVSADREPILPDAAPSGAADDPVRERLLDAAATVFAEHGFAGARIQDVVRTAGLTTGAVYGRYRGKAELLHDAVVSRAVPQVQYSAEGIGRVADLVAASATRLRPGLDEHEALLLETYVAARREEEVADAVADADDRWREAVAPLVDAATTDGTVAPDVDPEAVLFLVRVLRLGLLLHRGSGLPGPDADSWATLVDRVVASFGTDAPDPTAARSPNADSPTTTATPITDPQGDR